MSEPLSRIKSSSGSIDAVVLTDESLYFDRNINGTAESPYDDLDTVPDNTVIMYSKFAGVAHYPASNSGLVFTYGENGYSSQYVTDIWQRKMYFRTRKGSGNSSQWIDLTDNRPYLYYYGNCNSDNPPAPYNDADDVPVNSTILYSKTTGVANLPASDSGTLLTYGDYSGRYFSQIYNAMWENSLYYRSGRGSSFSAWKKLETEGEAHEGDFFGCVSLFETVGVVGDSFASGQVYFSEGGNETNYNISWPAIMSRKFGIDVANYSRPGESTRSFIDSSGGKGLEKLLSEDAKKLYIVALGINDGYLREYPLGSLSDITSEPSSNPNTFYGNYGRIVEEIMGHAPDAKMVLTTLPNLGYANYSDAIVEIAQHYGVPYADLRNDDYFSSSYFGDTFTGSHPTAVGYSGMANAYAKAVEKTFETFTDYYKDFIGA